MKKKERIKGRAAAIIGMIALILISVPVGSCVSLARERGKVTVLYYGSDDEWGILEDLAWYSSQAANLVTLAGKYLPEQDAQVSAVRAARLAVPPRSTPSASGALSSRMHVLRSLTALGMGSFRV